jgi:hypothetical protein
MAASQMDSLLKLVTEEVKKPGKKINWVRISSNLFGTVMIHRVINEQVKSWRYAKSSKTKIAKMAPQHLA